MTHAVADILDRLSDLPPFPKVTTRLLTMLEDPKVGVDELASVVSADPSLVLKVIHLSNSPFYMTSTPIQTVKEAVLVLGINTIKSITAAASIQKGLSKYTPRPDVFSRDAFWKHSYATAIAASRLAAKEARGSTHKVYLAGLIHDIGKQLIAYYWPESWNRIIAHVKASNEPYYSIEPKLFMSTHTEIAAILCRNWQFPDDVVDMIENHHNDVAAGDALLVEKKILRKANLIASAVGFQFPPENPLSEAVIMQENCLELCENLEDDVLYQLRVLES